MRLSARGLGLLIAVATLAIDQADKLWTIHGLAIAERQPIVLTPFFELVMAWNPGISYSLLPADSAEGRLALVAVALAATALLGLWLWRARTRWTAAAIGLLIGGALGNAYDRLAYGAVADFFHFHVGSFSWYIFNLADVAIVAGVVILLGESFLARRPEDPEAATVSLPPNRRKGV